MRRVRFVVSAVVAVVLISSLFFVPGSFAEPLGAGLLDRFGSTSSGQGDAGSEAIPFYFSLPVTVKNMNEEPVPVTVQGTSGSPLTATIQGSVSTEQENLSGSQPFQQKVDFLFGDAQTITKSIDVPDNKILIIRYVSGRVDLELSDKLSSLIVESKIGGSATPHYIIPGQIEVDGAETIYHFGAETWLEADPGTQLQILVRRNTSLSQSTGGAVIVSGYLLDPPA